MFFFFLLEYVAHFSCYLSLVSLILSHINSHINVLWSQLDVKRAVNAPSMPLLFISLAVKYYTICIKFCNLLSQHQPAVGRTELQPMWLSVCGHECVCVVFYYFFELIG